MKDPGAALYSATPGGKVIPVSLFETIRHWHSQGMANREMARRLGIDPKTVRRQLRKIAAGATEPMRTSPGSKLDRYDARIRELVELGRTAWSIHQELNADPTYDACYDLLKKRVRRLRQKQPKVYERLEHPPGAEAQADFGELVRVRHQGHLVRTWAYVAVLPHSRWKYADVVLDQTVPTFLSCVQNGIRESGVIPQRFSIDNLASAVLRKHFQERSYQREFSKLCAHYGTLPNAVRPRRPTDKGMVENGIGALKKFLRGRIFDSFEELRAVAVAWARSSKERPHSVTGRKPADLLAGERRGELPEPFPIARWSEHRVRTDCHIQLFYNFYSVPYRLVGKRAVVRLDATSVTVYDDFAVVARHERLYGRGQSSTDRSHYPPQKRKSTQEIHHERVARIRAVGSGAAAFYNGLLHSRDHVHSDAYRAFMALIERTDPQDLDRACARAAHFGNYSLDALRTIIERRLYTFPLDDLAPAPAPAAMIELARPLAVYAQLIGGATC
jgi:transposase